MTFKPNGKRLYEMSTGELSRLADEAHEAGNMYWEVRYREQISLTLRIAESFNSQCSTPIKGVERG
jgi:hypothetical protein